MLFLRKECAYSYFVQMSKIDPAVFLFSLCTSTPLPAWSTSVRLALRKCFCELFYYDMLQRQKVWRQLRLLY